MLPKALTRLAVRHAFLLTGSLPSFFTLGVWHFFCRFLTGQKAAGKSRSTGAGKAEFPRVFVQLRCATRIYGRGPACHFSHWECETLFLRHFRPGFLPKALTRSAVRHAFLLTGSLPSFFTLGVWHFFCRFLTGQKAAGKSRSTGAGKAEFPRVFVQLRCATRIFGRGPACHFSHWECETLFLRHFRPGFLP